MLGDTQRPRRHQSGTVKVRKKRSGKKRWIADLGKINGRRIRKAFPTEARAKAFIRAKQREIDNLGTKALTIRPEDYAEFISAREKLNGHGSMTEAIDFFLAHRAHITPSPLPKAIDAFQKAKLKAGKRKNYVRVLKSTLKGFALNRDHKQCHEISPTEISEWLYGNGWSLTTIRGRLIDLHTFFKWCIARGHCKNNPAAAVERPSPEEKAPCSLSLDEITTLLREGLKIDPEATGGFIAPVLFGGLRPEEAKRLAKDDFRDTEIRLPGQKAKGRRTRHIEITPQLKEWLSYAKVIPIVNLRKRLAKIRKAAGIKWPHDCLRHSFCSYMTAARGARWTSEQAGHSEEVLFQRYRDPKSKEDALKFAELTPGSVRAMG